MRRLGIAVAAVAAVAALLATACSGNGATGADADGRVVVDAAPDGDAAHDGPAGERDAAAPLPPPTNVRASAANGDITVSWDAVAGADSYAIYWSRAPGVTKAVCTQFGGIAATTYTHSGLVPTSTYHYAVVAERGGVRSALSAEVSATPVPSSRRWHIGVVGPAKIPRLVSDQSAAVSMAVAPSGEHHIAYYDETRNDPGLAFASDAGGKWTSSAIVPSSGGNSTAQHFVSLAVDAKGHDHVAFISTTSLVDPNHLRYATNASGAWVV